MAFDSPLADTELGSDGFLGISFGSERCDLVCCVDGFSECVCFFSADTELFCGLCDGHAGADEGIEVLCYFGFDDLFSGGFVEIEPIFV